ncbi:unnamed protein product [Mytilus coruscus]|uniref:C3H1-type domain-containing protein n=1 Tax=Mytilus coruscus TaxID=42192 RepID=A0A6J8D5E4_MYTCO|nr:unnamed protein product [Mytilus coruscus]
MPRRRRQPNNPAAPARNLRRRGPQLDEEKQPPHRRQQNDNVEVQQELNMPNQTMKFKRCYLGLNEDGRLITQTNLSKKKTIINIETWTDAFLVYSQVLIQRHPAVCLHSYHKGAAADSTIEKWYMYDQQFRLRVARNPTKNWDIIDAQLWLQIMDIASSNTQQPRINKCFDFNFKGVCTRNSCRFSHTCLKCSLNHPSIRCRRYLGLDSNKHRAPGNGNRTFKPRVQTGNRRFHQNVGNNFAPK